MEDGRFQTAAPPENLLVDVASQPIDPDRPRWGPGAGLGAWAVSILAPIILGVIVVIPFVLAQQQAEGTLPGQSVKITEGLAIASIIATIGGHLIAMLVCWMIVTRNGKDPFFDSMGWHWGGLNAARKAALIIGVPMVMIGIQFALSRVLPDSDNTQFEQMLRTSATVRLMVVAMAVLIAPIVEEVIYRGVLYSGLRSKLAASPSILIVTLLFAAVHVPQYWGAWASLVALTILSLILTMIRAASKSILPCAVVHLAFNLVGGVSILLNKWD